MSYGLIRNTLKLTTALMIASASIHSHAEIVKPLQSCIESCIAKYSCDVKKPIKKGKKHAKPKAKKPIVKKEQPKQEPNKCETEYIFLPELHEGSNFSWNWNMPMPPLLPQAPSVVSDARPNSALTSAIWNPPNMPPIFATGGYFVTTNVTPNPPSETPLPSSVLLFASALVFFKGGKFSRCA